MTFNVLIATIGRPSLQKMLDSLSPQLEKEDCLTVVFDGFATPPTFDFSMFKCQVNIYCEEYALGFYGHAIRNKYASFLQRRDFVMHADDDDTYVADSFDKLRNICLDKDVLYVAKHTNNGTLIPALNNNTVCFGNIGTPSGIIPYELNKKEKWEHKYGGDGDFYVKLTKHLQPIFLNEIIYTVSK